MISKPLPGAVPKRTVFGEQVANLLQEWLIVSVVLRWSRRSIAGQLAND